MEAGRLSGTVKWFNDAKGYGFIARQDGGRDLFVHYTQIRGDGHRTLATGEPVEFGVGDSEKGPMAVDVERAA